MPLNTSKSQAAFHEIVKTEIAAGKPPKQAVAIAYATKGEKKSEHHSDHSAKRSQHYHQHVAEPIRPINPTRIGRGATKMTRAEQQINNLEESGESDKRS